MSRTVEGFIRKTFWTVSALGRLPMEPYFAPPPLGVPSLRNPFGMAKGPSRCIRDAVHVCHEVRSPAVQLPISACLLALLALLTLLTVCSILTGSGALLKITQSRASGQKNKTDKINDPVKRMPRINAMYPVRIMPKLHNNRVVVHLVSIWSGNRRS